mgnify:CR=1 FL=1
MLNTLLLNTRLFDATLLKLVLLEAILFVAISLPWLGSIAHYHGDERFYTDAAMRTSRIQVFQYELGGRKYKVEPWIAGDDALENRDGQQSTETPKTKAEPTLPEGTKFAAGDAAVESRSEKVEQQLTDGAGATWSRPIMFYPDGSTGDAYIVIGNEHNHGIRIDLRGMTAAVRVSEITDLKTLEDDTTLSK